MFDTTRGLANELWQELQARQSSLEQTNEEAHASQQQLLDRQLQVFELLDRVDA